MNIVKIEEFTRNFNSYVLFIKLNGKEQVLSQEYMIGLCIAAAAGILLALFGLKIVRVWAVLMGLATGWTVGYYAADALGASDTVMFAAEVVLGILFMILGGVLYRAAVFLTVFGSVSLAAIYLSSSENNIVLLICLGAGLIAGILAVKFTEFLTIIATAVCGAALGGSALYYLVPADFFMAQVLICVAVGVVGVFIQLLMESHRRKRLNLKKAAEIREEKSTENDVERARAFIEDLDEDVREGGEKADNGGLKFETVSLDDIEDEEDDDEEEIEENEQEDDLS